MNTGITAASCIHHRLHTLPASQVITRDGQWERARARLLPRIIQANDVKEFSITLEIALHCVSSTEQLESGLILRYTDNTHTHAHHLERLKGLDIGRIVRSTQ